MYAPRTERSYEILNALPRRWLAHALLIAVVWLSGPPPALAGVDPLDLSLPVVGMVPGVQTAWIARHMVQNGMPMSIRSFISVMPIHEVLKRYQRWLEEHGSGHVVIVKSSGVNTLATSKGVFFISIQGANKPGNESAGYIVVSLLPGFQHSSKKTSLPIPSPGQVISVQRYDDGGKRGQSVTLISPRPTTLAADEVVASFEDAGWKQLKRYSQTDSGDIRLFMFRRGSHYAQAVMQPDRQQITGGTLVLINEIEGQ